ncbi:hypothetical protein KY346_04955 [Candidatus Woesearchaeota archaeon]|nr:hypothetical protein [Candidatus Woesearchaeota archaeon]
MTEYTTLIKKSCGHHGLVRSKFPQSIISCSQCAIDEKDPEKARVQVLKRKMLPSKEVPELDFAAMDKWIRKKLEE